MATKASAVTFGYGVTSEDTKVYKLFKNKKLRAFVS
jgi:hypothetical protein